MKVIAINGSPKKSGNTFTALQAMSEELAKYNIDTEIVHVGGELIHGCISCRFCDTSENNKCVFSNDPVNDIAEKMRQADGIILGSPVYYGSIAGTMKSFLDRVFFTSSAHFKNKVGTAVAAVRRAGGTDTFNQLNNYLNLAGIITPPSQYWGIVYGREPGEALQDLEGMQTVRRMARDMAWLMNAVESNKNNIVSDQEDRIFTHFVR